eukprot:GHVR01100808.1.p1 GENE.GHVR01100808.1~~GHVR01100808.1.p1  ORF type:complete len:110 (+),score=15.50 GHVR01100808.1:229-558(+)
MEGALIKAVSEGLVHKVESLVEEGLHVNSAGNDGDTPLHCASRNGHIDVVRVLRGAYLNSKNNDGNTALVVASMYGHSDIVRCLIDNGAEINYRNSVSTSVTTLSGSLI